MYNIKLLSTLASKFELTCKHALQKYNLKKIAISIRPDDRVNLSGMKFDMGKFILSRDEKYPKNNKPSAFYYAFGKQWVNFTNFASGGVYILDLNMSRMLQLTPDNLKEFIDKYCYYVSNEEAMRNVYVFVTQQPSGYVIDWSKVKADYDGMEIKNLQNIKDKFKTLGLNSYMPFLDCVDVDGGFFWNPSVLNHATKVATIEDGELQELTTTHRYRLKPDHEVVFRGRTREEFEPEKSTESDYWSAISNVRENKESLFSENEKKDTYSFFEVLNISDIIDSIESGNLDQLFSELKEKIKSSKDKVKLSVDTFTDNYANQITKCLIGTIFTESYIRTSSRKFGNVNRAVMEYLVKNFSNKNITNKQVIKNTLRSFLKDLASENNLNKMAKYLAYESYQKHVRDNPIDDDY